MRRIVLGLLLVISQMTLGVGSVFGQQTVLWTGGGDGTSFGDASNWNPSPAAIDQAALVDNYIVDDAFAFVGIDVATVAGLTLTPPPAGSLSLEFRQGFVDTFDSTDPNALEPFGGYAGDDDDTTTETMLVDGADVFGHFVSAGLQIHLNSGSLTLRGVGNPINQATIDFGGSLTGQLLSFETPEDFLAEHFDKLTVSGSPAVLGANIEVGSDGGTGTLVEVAASPLTPGDLTGEGDVDATDWGIFKSNLFTTFSPATLRDGYLLGDMDADGDNDQVDFGLYKHFYELANGQGSLAALATVPEPGTATLAALASVWVLGFRRRWRAQLMIPLNGSSLRPSARLLVLCLAFASAINFGSAGWAILVLEENFDYADGPLSGASGGIGWTGSWGSPVGDDTPPTGSFNVAGNQAIYDGAGGGQIVITQERLLAAPVQVDSATAITIELDAIIGTGPGDVNFGRGIGVNFLSGGNVAFTLGKRLNGGFGLWDGGIGGASNELATVQPSGFQGLLDLTAVLTYNGTDTSVTVSDADTIASYDFNGQQISFDAIQITGYHQETTSNGIDSLSVDTTVLAEILPTLEIDPSGNGTLKNATGEDITFDLYKLTSPNDSLNTSYAGIQDGPVQAGFPAGSGSGDGWEKAGGNSTSEMGEAYLLGDSTLADGDSLLLGQVLSTVDSGEAITFVYRDSESGSFFPGFVTFTTGVVQGDFNNNGVVDAADYTVWLGNLGATSDSAINGAGDGVDGVTIADYAVWRNNFGATSGISVGTAQVPEPVSLVIFVSAVLCGAAFRRRLV